MKKILITILTTLFLASTAYAGQLGMGVTGSMAAIAAEGSDSDQNGAADTSGRTATASNNAFIGSIFAEYTMDGGMTFGIDVFGKSAPYKDIYKHFGLISSNIVNKLKKFVEN